jgi:glycosyltransferase involved in cell wall biosynthesis
MLRFSRLVRTLQPDVVQANAFHALKYASLLKRVTRGAWPLVYRNVSLASHWISHGWRRHWGRWLLRPVDRVLSVSDIAAADFCATYGFPQSRMVTIRRGVELPGEVDFPGTRKRIAAMIGCKPEDPLLFHLGGFTPEKNHDGLLRALAIVCKRYPDVRLVLCGDGPLWTPMQRRAGELGVSGNAYFLGNRPEARELLAGADLLLLTSCVEGIPGVVLEAAARMVPSVATNVGAMADAIAHESSGLLVPAGDMESLAEGCCALLADPVRRKRMGTAARQFVAETHEIGASVDRFESLYRTLYGPHSNSRI